MARRRLFACFAGLFCAVWFASTLPAQEQKAAAQGERRAVSDEAAQKQEILRKLETTKVTLDFTGTSLQDVMDFLREMTGLNFVIDPRVTDNLTAEQLAVTIRLTDVSLKSALRIILKMRELTLIYRHGVLVVIHESDLADTVVMRVYDVRDLLVKIKDFPGPNIELKMNEVGTEFPDDTFGNGSNPTEDPDFITNLIKTHTCSKSWEENPKVSIALSNGLLVVAQTPAGHKEVLNLLNRLREMK